MKRYRKRTWMPPLWQLMAMAGVIYVYLKDKDLLKQAGHVLGALFITALVAALVKWFARAMRAYGKEQKYLGSPIYVIDKMAGHEFEEYLIAHFRRLGYQCKNVGAGGHDYGVDILITKCGRTTAVQAKRYQAKVGIKAIQEIISGKQYYKADAALVVTNRFFTKSAIELAQSCGVELWDRKVCQRTFKITQNLGRSDARKEKRYCQKGA